MVSLQSGQNYTGTNMFPKVPEDVLMHIWDMAEVTPEIAYVCRQFRSVFNRKGDNVYASYLKNYKAYPYLRGIAHEVEIDYQECSNLDKVKAVYGRIMASIDTSGDGGIEVKKETLKTYSDPLSPERLADLTRFDNYIDFAIGLSIARELRQHLNGYLRSDWYMPEVPFSDKNSEDKLLNYMNEYKDQLKEIVSFKIESTKMTELPKEIGLLENLECLVLSGNRLITLPDEIANLSKLEKFDISNNPIKSLPQAIYDSTNPVISQNPDVLALMEAG